jgi:hypothetical protein
MHKDKLHFLSIASLNSKHAHTPVHAYMNADIRMVSKRAQRAAARCSAHAAHGLLAWIHAAHGYMHAHAAHALHGHACIQTYTQHRPYLAAA